MLKRFFGFPIPFKPAKAVTAAPECIEIFLAGENRLIALRRISKTQRYTLRIKSGTRDLVVTMPPRGSLNAARSFLERHESWLVERLKHLPEKVPFKEGSIIPVQGIPHEIHHAQIQRGTVWLDSNENSVRLYVTGSAEHHSRRITQFLKIRAKQELTLATRKYAAQINVDVRRVTIKDTISRWGSCSSNGNIAYSWRLIMAPPYVLDYLAAHEVAHRLEMNHSARFWKLLHGMCAETQRAEAWLKKHGRTLHNYG